MKSEEAKVTGNKAASKLQSVSVPEILERLRKYRGYLPVAFRFDRDEANDRAAFSRDKSRL